MKAVVCTLFEGNYHLGVAGLINSLYYNGYRGDVYVGYRGMLPKWAEKAKGNLELGWDNGRTLLVCEGLEIHFLPLLTKYHLTNYKPDFMIELIKGPAEGCETIFYFDPDIVVTAPFKYLLEWVTCGLAVCEDVNSPVQEFHPRRVAWRNYFGKSNINLIFRNQIYVNGGFIGVQSKDFNFLSIWRNIQEIMGESIGGLNRSAFKTGDQLNEFSCGDYAPFGKTDQDALNAAVEAYSGNISYMGKEAMAFGNGLAIMPHALGHFKPWKLKLFLNCLKGHSPRLVDKLFWNLVDFPIKVFPQTKILRMRYLINLYSFIGRFYSKK